MENLRSASGPTELSLNGDGKLLTDIPTGVRNFHGIRMLRNELVAECYEPPTITRSISEPVSHTEESTTSSG